MLNLIRNSYPQKSFAILGSGPSLPDYFKRDQDQVIGVNGAGYILKPDDIFLSGDEIAHKHSWYRGLDPKIRRFLRTESAIFLPEFVPDPLRDLLIREYQDYIDAHPTLELYDGSRYLFFDNPFIRYIGDRIPEPLNGNIVLRSISSDQPVLRSMESINVGGTSSCMALQVAYVMGAKEVHLYGVEFSNIVDGNAYDGGNYYYRPKSGETGRTLDSQRLFMDRIISQMDIPVHSHGPTSLESTIRH